MIDTNDLLLLQAFRALEAADCEIDFLDLCLVSVPKKFVDAPETGQSPSN